MGVDVRTFARDAAGRLVLCSDNGGRTWINVSGNLACDPQTGAYGVHWIAVNPEPLVLYTRYHRSTDRGLSWERLEAPEHFVPRLLVPGRTAVIYGSINGQAGRCVCAVPWID